jgi:putative DNA primase/helicase
MAGCATCGAEGIELASAEGVEGLICAACVPTTNGQPLILPSPSAPMDVARAIIDQLNLDDRLRHWRGSWWEWKGSHWIEIEDRGVRSTLYRATEHASYMNAEGEMKSWAPNRQKIANLIEALAAIDHLGDHVDQPCWLDGREQAGPIVATANGLLDVDRRELLPHSPQFFNRVSVPFDFDADPVEPERWLSFLADLWPDDPESIAALQEFFGYVLSGQLDQHKILLVVGPTRAGKGVITRILAAMVGPQNVAGPTLSSMGGNFGLAPLLGKPLAIVSDARLSGRNSQVVVERLLAISGEDAITIDRKYKEQWTGKLPCRFVIVSNELPQLGDASAAIANRFVPLVLGRSWLGNEDRDLEDDLRRELSGILSWSLDGLQRLQDQGRFTSPPSAEEALATLIDLASPVGAFLRECCELGAAAEVDVDDLWSAWKEWCDGAGQPPGTKAMLGRNLRAAQPQVRKSRTRDGEDRRQVYLGVALRGAE